MKGKVKILLFILICLIITGCGCTVEDKGEPNQRVSLLGFYAPSNFKNRSDLRGAIYTDNDRKIFAKGDTNDYSTFIYIDVIKQAKDKELSEYIDSINTNNLKEGDVKFIKKEHKTLEVYAREGYETQQGNIDIINYAYITTIDNDYYFVTITGPKDSQSEVKDLATKVLLSLQKEVSN